MAITRGLTTVANCKLSLGIATGVTTYDADLENYISAATPVIENITGPMYAESRTLTFDGGGAAISLPFKINAVTSVTVGGTVTTNYVANLTAGIIYAGTSGSPTVFTYGTQNVVVVVTVGSATIPPHIELATRELIRHMWQLGRQANRPGVAEAASASADVPSGFAVPRRVIELCQASPRVAGFA